MIKKIKIVMISIVFINLLLISNLYSEPFVVHEYGISSQSHNNETNKSFDKNEDYSLYYIIKKNDSLSGIINKHYGNNNLNLSVVKSAVVLKNKHAFVRNNANFMFANKRLYLPSINEIKNLIYKNNNRNSNQSSSFKREENIYYFGN